MTRKRLKVRRRMVRNVNQLNAEKSLMCSPQNLMPVNVFVSMTPGIDRILSTTTCPRTLKSSASIFAIRSYSPNRGWSSTISLTFRSSLYTSCSLAGAVLMSTNPMAIPGHPAGNLLTQYNPFVHCCHCLRVVILPLERRVSPRPSNGLRPGRQIRLRTLRLDDETRDGGGENAAALQIVSVRQSGVEAGPVRVARAGHINHPIRGNARDSSAAIPCVDVTPFRAMRRDNDG